jgi:hypothetical protein
MVSFAGNGFHILAGTRAGGHWHRCADAAHIFMALQQLPPVVGDGEYGINGSLGSVCTGAR